MTANSQLLTTTPKTKTKANNQNRNRTIEMEITWRVIPIGEWEGERVGKGTENKQHK